MPASADPAPPPDRVEVGDPDGVTVIRTNGAILAALFGPASVRRAWADIIEADIPGDAVVVEESGVQGSRALWPHTLA